MKVIIVGAGISGIVCGWRLANAGCEVTVVEKGRGVGGRMATRRMDGARIDHGAQFFTVRDSRMKELLSYWETQGSVMPWYDRIPGRDDVPTGQRFRGKNGMTAPVKALTSSLTVETNFFVENINRDEKGWTVFNKGGTKTKFTADHLIITIPSVQILDLFERSDFALDDATMLSLRSIRHSRCLAILGLLSEPSKLGEPGTITHPVPEIDWISDNQVKGISERPACTIHASDQYSQKFWDNSDEDRVPYLLAVAEECLGSKITNWTSHRWGFAKPLKTFGASHWHSVSEALTLAGDGFGGERIENAALSGWEAAESILSKN